MTKYEENAFRLLIKELYVEQTDDKLSDEFLSGLNCGREESGIELENLLNLMIKEEQNRKIS